MEISLAKQARYHDHQVMSPAELAVDQTYQVRKMFNGENTFLVEGTLLSVGTGPKAELVISGPNGPISFEMSQIHLVPNKNGNWDASTWHLVKKDVSSE